MAQVGEDDLLSVEAAIHAAHKLVAGHVEPRAPFQRSSYNRVKVTAARPATKKVVEERTNAAENYIQAEGAQNVDRVNEVLDTIKKYGLQNIRRDNWLSYHQAITGRALARGTQTHVAKKAVLKAMGLTPEEFEKRIRKRPGEQ